MDISSVDYAGLVVALFAVLGVAGNYLKMSGRSKYLGAITDILDTMLDFVTWGQMLMKTVNGEPCDQAAFKTKGEEITTQINKIKTDLGF